MGINSIRKMMYTWMWLAGLLSGGVATAHVQKFEASWEDSRWVVESSPRQCSLTHEIPRFGRARFEQQSGRRLQFAIYADQPPVSDRKALVHSLAPPWKHRVAPRELGGFQLKQGKNPLRVPREQALRIYYELEEGMQPVIQFSDWGDAQDQVRVTLMPVRFREVLPEFLRCTANLLYLDFEPVGEKKVFFATDSDRLTRAARRILENVARDYRKQGDFRIVLGGHADERGEDDYNVDLSRRRALMTARYLRSRGVPKKAIESRYFGESQPHDPESGEKAWARNRRVTVWLADR